MKSAVGWNCPFTTQLLWTLAFPSWHFRSTAPSFPLQPDPNEEPTERLGCLSLPLYLHYLWSEDLSKLVCFGSLMMCLKIRKQLQSQGFLFFPNYNFPMLNCTFLCPDLLLWLTMDLWKLPFSSCSHSQIFIMQMHKTTHVFSNSHPGLIIYMQLYPNLILPCHFHSHPFISVLHQPTDSQFTLICVW